MDEKNMEKKRNGIIKTIKNEIIGVVKESFKAPTKWVKRY
ncbi:MAG: hypothetical protein ACI9CF_001421 [Candidatus Omnitrophota bacterium]